MYLSLAERYMALEDNVPQLDTKSLSLAVQIRDEWSNTSRGPAKV